MTTVVTSLLAVVLLAIAVNAASVPDTAKAYYYEPVVPPYGPYPARGYVVSYLPKYTNYRIVTPVHHPPRKTEYDEDQHEEEEPKYYYGGKYKGNNYD